MELVATAVWVGTGWQAVIVIPYVRAVWRGHTSASWHIAADEASAQLASGI